MLCIEDHKLSLGYDNRININFFILYAASEYKYAI